MSSSNWDAATTGGLALIAALQVSDRATLAFPAMVRDLALRAAAVELVPKYHPVVAGVETSASGGGGAHKGKTADEEGDAK